MIRFLSLPCGPRSAPHRVLVEITGVQIVPADPLAPSYSDPDRAVWHTSWGPVARPESPKWDDAVRQSKMTMAEAQAAWDANLAERIANAKVSHARAVDSGYRHTILTWGTGENEIRWDSHATLTEIESAIINATGPIAIVTHAYPTEPA